MPQRFRSVSSRGIFSIMWDDCQSLADVRDEELHIFVLKKNTRTTIDGAIPKSFFLGDSCKRLATILMIVELFMGELMICGFNSTIMSKFVATWKREESRNKYFRKRRTKVDVTINQVSWL